MGTEGGDESPMKTKLPTWLYYHSHPRSSRIVWRARCVDGDPRSWPGSAGPEEDDEDEERDGGNDDGHNGGPHRCQGETQGSDTDFHAKFVCKIKHKGS